MSSVLQVLIADLKRYSPQQVILFGSMARGDADEYSDLDILIIKKTKKRFLQRLKEVALLLRNSLPPVNVFVYTKREIEKMKKVNNPFIANALRHGKVLYEAKPS